MTSISNDAVQLSMLLVEDDAVTRELLSSAIRTKYPGMVLMTAPNGRCGLNLFRTHRIDVVLTDITMPQMDGVTMAREMRLMMSDTAIIAMTAYRSECEEDDTVMDHYLHKPLAFPQLFTVLNAIIARVLSSRPPRTT